MSQVELSELYQFCQIDFDRFDPLFPPSGCTTHDPPACYKAVYEEYFKTGFFLPIPHHLKLILLFYHLRLPQIGPNSLRMLACYFFFHRSIHVSFDIEVFRGFFNCKTSESWYYFSKRALKHSILPSICPP